MEDENDLRLVALQEIVCDAIRRYEQSTGLTVYEIQVGGEHGYELDAVNINKNSPFTNDEMSVDVLRVGQRSPNKKLIRDQIHVITEEMMTIHASRDFS